MNSKIPAPADRPDPVRDNTWDPREFPAHLGGVVEDRETFHRKRDGQPFEVLSIRTDDELFRVLGGRTHLAQLIEENDPQRGDGISVTCFGQEPGGNRYLYGMRVDKSRRLVNRQQRELGEAAKDDKAAVSVHEPLGE